MKSFTISISILLMILAILPGETVMAQNFTQTIKGQVIDGQSKTPLPGANLILLGSDPIVGTSSDANGYFQLDGVPVGRASLEVRFIGYATATLSNLNVTSGKELIINIQLEEELLMAEETVITASRDKTQPLNEMASVSARTFSVEESMRFAGARNDVARMATNFAGVSNADDATNDIVIRGNSPNGLLWRLEGIEIPNPNHFGQIGASGGPVSMLNNNVLSNSDFLTGAFPAEYGNALSGVFDLEMRTGNYDKFEFLGQIGFNGFEAGIEGPILKKNKGSFFANYRYSTLGVLADLGFDFGTGAAIPYYQDFNFKVDLPTKKAGKFSVFGLAGKSDINFVNSELDPNSGDDLFSQEDFDIYSRSRMGVIGFNHTYFFNETTYGKLTLAASYQQQRNTLDSIIPETRNTVSYSNNDLQLHNLRAHYRVNKKFNNKNTAKLGLRFDRIGYNFIDSTFYAEDNAFRTQTDENGNTWLAEAYVEWLHKFSDELILTTGLHYQYLKLNEGMAIEPRAGLKYIVAPRHTLSLGYGLHSRTQMPQIYFTQYKLPDGNYVQTNTGLDFTRSHHFVLGYDYNISPTLRFKAETYYQHLFDAPVEIVESSYSALNQSSMQFNIPDSLKNGGTGRNYGLELTLEKFMDRGLYFLVTTSLFDSKYKGSDGVERSTAFDSKYVINMLGGKEFRLKSKKENPKTMKWLVADVKLTTAGGQRYTPLDIEESVAQGGTVYNDDEAFSKQFDNYFRMDIRLGFRWDSKKISQEFAFDIQNVTNYKNPLYVKFDRTTLQEEFVYQIGFLPIAQYRIIF